MKRLNLGCGRDTMPGWINVDAATLPGIDVIADLDRCADTPLPFDESSVDEFLLSHVIEHIRSPLPLMQDLWRVARPGAKLLVRCPYGHSDDAWEDPTHVRPYFLHSFDYFSQPAYWRADYGYRGDWRTEQIVLIVDGKEHEGQSRDQILARVMTLRNVVKEMLVELAAVKPARPPDKKLQTPLRVEILQSGQGAAL